MVVDPDITRMERKLKVLMEYANNAPWLTLRHIMVIDYIFLNHKDHEVIFAHDIKKHLGIDVSTVVRVLYSLSNDKKSRRNRTCLNWINYEICKKDGRYREVTLNSLGKKVMKEYLKAPD
mgnify:CR=1 FL=1